MLQPYSQTERAFRDTLIHKAEEKAFAKLSALFGFARLRNFSLRAWRMGLNLIAYGPRGTFGLTHGLAESLLRESWVEVDDVLLDPVQPSRLTKVDGFEASHTGWLVRVFMTLASGEEGSWLFLIENATDDYLDLCSVRTASWQAARWDAGELAAEAQDVRVVLLPFRIYEPTQGPPPEGEDWPPADLNQPGVLRLHVFESLNNTPPSYLLDPAGADRDAVAPGSPYGGHMMDLFDGDPDSDDGDQTDGPFPLYLADDSAAPGLEKALSALLAAGLRVLVRAGTGWG